VFGGGHRQRIWEEDQPILASNDEVGESWRKKGGGGRSSGNVRVKYPG
jgi:hypothetical protein